MAKEQGLSPAAANWFQGRAIDPETAVRYGVYTTKRGGSGAHSGEVVVFPFVENGVVINRKYRGREKTFSQDAGAPKCFWNADVLADPALHDGSQRLIITEGEMDALACIQSGFPFVVSVPDGAPQKASDDPIDPEHDKKFSYVFRAWDHLQKIKQIVIATDNDGPGKVLAGELVRRFGASRCLFVSYPENSKDINEVLVAHGQQGVARVISSAKFWPVNGLYKLSDYPDTSEIVTYSTGLPALDPYLRAARGAFWVVTGIPGHGKSTWLNTVAMNLAMREDWNICLASFEADVKPILRRDLRLMYGGSPSAADDFIERHFTFIDQRPLHDGEDGDIEWLLDRAKDAVTRFGVDMLIVDPWNEIEHRRRRDESETEYTGRAIRMFKRFASNFDVLVAIVAHPTKMIVGKEGAVREPNLYDIAGSANWYNKADVGVVVHRPTLNGNLVNVSIKKVRVKPDMGREGIVQFEFDEKARRFLDAPDALVLHRGEAA